MAQAQVQEASHVEVHLDKISLKKLYIIKEQVLHELSAHHLGLAK